MVKTTVHVILWSLVGILLLLSLRDLLGLFGGQAALAQPNKPQISFSGGPGDTPATAVVISGAANSLTGIDAEYQYLEKKFGRRNVDWNLIRQSVLQEKGKVYDRMDLELKDGSRKTVFFDITAFFGKF